MPKTQPAIRPRDAIRGQQLHQVQEECLFDGIGCRGQSVHVADVDCAVEVNLEQLFHFGVVPVGAAVTVAFVDRNS